MHRVFYHGLKPLNDVSLLLYDLLLLFDQAFLVCIFLYQRLDLLSQSLIVILHLNMLSFKGLDLLILLDFRIHESISTVLARRLAFKLQISLFKCLYILLVKVNVLLHFLNLILVQIELDFKLSSLH